MKIVSVVLLASLIGASSISQAQQAQPSPDDDACGMVICLSTPDKNMGGVACAMAVKQFVKIKAKTAGVIDPIKTIKKRHDKLSSCKGARASDTELIMAQYGLLM